MGTYGRRSGRLWQLAAVVGLVALTACEASLKENSFGNIEDFVSGFSTLDGTVTGSLVSDAIPGANGGPDIAVAGVPATINGGSARITVSSATPFQTVLLALQYFDHYYQVDLPAPVTSVDLVVNMSQAAPQATITFLYEAASLGGPVGAPLMQNIRVLRVGSGDVQVSVAWDSPTDVDLHVVDPSNEEIFFGNLQAQSGGKLDLDSNAACSIDNVNNENIVWPAGGAPSGTYNVFLVYWSACSQAQTNYVVTVLVKGQAPQIFSGTLTGNGSSSVQYPITSFTY